MRDDGQGRAVLITGASSGIGAACARALDRRGFRVFAGVRRMEDAAPLVETGGPYFAPVILDVTDPASIRSARATIEGLTGGSGLWGLVNNAGIAVAGPMEHLPPADLRRQFEVNVVGQVAVTQAFLPLVRLAGGRIVFMSSIAGRVAAPMLGPYSASKHAIEAIADALRVELAPWQIPVALVEPGAIATPIWDKGLRDADKRVEALPPLARVRYEPMIEAATAYGRQSAERAVRPGHVARAVHHALTSKRPKARYVVGRDARLSMAVERWAPTRLRDRLVRWRMKL